MDQSIQGENQRSERMRRGFKNVPMIGCLRRELVGCDFSRRFDNQAGITRGGLLFAAGDEHLGSKLVCFGTASSIITLDWEFNQKI